MVKSVDSKEYQKQYYQNHKEKKLEYQKQYYEGHKEKKIEYQKQYYQNHKEKKLEYGKQYYQGHKEKKIEYQKQYRKQNKERLKEYQKQYRKKNAEKIREYKKLQYEKHREKISEYQKQYYEKNREKISEYQKQDYYWYKSHGICPYCKTNYLRRGKSSCATCAEYLALKNKKKPPLTDSQKERKRKRMKRYRDLLIAFGVCRNCGKRNAVPNHTLCLDCLLKQNRRSREYRRKNGSIPIDLRYNSGFCYLCCKKIDDGQILCEECKNKKAKCAEYARSFIDRKKMRKQQAIYFKRG